MYVRAKHWLGTDWLIESMIVVALVLITTTPVAAFPKRMSDLEKKYLKAGAKYQVIDRAYFFRNVGRKFGSFRRYKTRQKKIYNMIFDFWDHYPELKDLRWLAYILGTGEYESAHRMFPVRETLASNDNRAIYLMDTHKAYKKVRYWARTKHHGYYYWRRLANHGNRTYLGRGLIQITHFENYRKWGKYMGMGEELYLKPEMAYNPDIATQALIKGMILGVYRHDRRGRHSLARYFVPQTVSQPERQQRKFYKRARSIVNGGLYHADKILVGAIKFKRLLRYKPRKPGSIPKVEDGDSSTSKPNTGRSDLYEELNESKKLIGERDAEIALLNDALSEARDKVKAQALVLEGQKTRQRAEESRFVHEKTALKSFIRNLEKTVQAQKQENKSLWAQIEKNQDVLRVRTAELNAASVALMEMEVKAAHTGQCETSEPTQVSQAVEQEISQKNKKIALLNGYLKKMDKRLRLIQYVEQKKAFEKLRDEKLRSLKIERKLYFAQARVKRLNNELGLLKVLNAEYQQKQMNQLSMTTVRKVIAQEFSVLNDELSLARSQLVFLRNKMKNMREVVAVKLAHYKEDRQRSAFGWKEKYKRLKQKLGQR